MVMVVVEGKLETPRKTGEWGGRIVGEALGAIPIAPEVRRGATKSPRED